jgi:mRNA interferase ChpB
MERGDIYMVDLDPSSGHEQRGYRPVVIVSKKVFNEATSCPIVLPITTGGGFARRIGFAVPLSGTKTVGIVRCDQPRALDLSSRNAHKVERLPSTILPEVLALAGSLFQ